MEEKEPTPVSNAFLTLLQNQRTGDCLQELSDKLNELSIAVGKTHAKGELTFKVIMKPLAKGGGNAVTITDVVTLKLPAVEKSVSVFYIGKEGDLTRNDPRQREFNLRSVPGGAAESNQTPQAAAV